MYLVLKHPALNVVAFGLVLLLIGGSGCGGHQSAPTQSPPKQSSSIDDVASQPPDEKTLDRDQTIATVERLLQQNDLAAAADKLRSLLVANPSDFEVLGQLAMVTAATGDLAAAIDLLDEIPTDDPAVGLPALGQSADWCLQLERFAEAESRFRKILELMPRASDAHRRLAYLYNRQGRRHEAADHIHALCRQGNVRQDELHALIQLSDAIYDDPDNANAVAGELQYWPIGEAAEARRLFTEKKFKQAVETLQPAIARGDQPPSIVAFFGRAAAEAQEDRWIQWWLGRCDESTKEYSEYWAALGIYLGMQNRHRESARALLEAVDRDPSDYWSAGRLRSVMETLGQTDRAAVWEERSRQLRETIELNNKIASSPAADTESMRRLAERLDSLGRSLEAVLWRTLAGLHRGLPAAATQRLNQQLRSLVATGSGLPSLPQRLCGIDLQSYPLPKLDPAPGSAEPRTPGHGGPLVVPQFEDVAGSVGIEHAYQVASTPLDFGFSVYQSVGGAVAVLDYDQDGAADLYFAQGGADPPDFIGQQTNLLYRHSDDGFDDVTLTAAASEYRYSLGVTAGDWNQDGFPDLVVANIGTNVLLINNGDGTFARQQFDDGDDKTLMTTSLAMADLTGDSLPDVFELNYLHDPNISRRPGKNDQGEVIESLMPREFDPGLDRMIINQDSGEPTFQDIGKRRTAARAGLGVVVGDFDHQAGNEVFVGNDVYANQLWTRSADGRWTDVAMLNGCAFGYNGAKTASMGIASGDFDHNGWLDFHITNFQQESVSLYLNEGGLFQDRNIQFGLDLPSKSVLGFGTQGIDYDNDGDVDLVVANGHIENAVSNRAPFEQPPQLFANRGDRFELANVRDRSGYFDEVHLGRGLATVDLDRDGRMDFVVTHLGQPSAVLSNRTSSDNHWVQLCLVGKSSERDAIGARIELTLGAQTEQAWVTAGDGFFSRNEAVIAVGLGPHTQIDQINIVWPSGERQQLGGLAADHRWLIVERQPQAWRLW